MDEFERIKTYFAPLAGPEGLSLLDDAALCTPPAGQDIVTTKDMLVEGIHVPLGAAPDLFARRALRTNLSDLAAMGAQPFGYLLGLALPCKVDESWLEGFASALQSDQSTFGLSLWGGDSVRTQGPILLSITALGSVAPLQALRRSGAQAGDDVYVSGSIGRAAAGLQIALGTAKTDNDQWRQAYEVPEPRLALGKALKGVASACADVSDGLLADAGHIAKASGVTAHIELPRVPMDADLPLEPIAAATAGDDYELVFTAPPSQREAIFTLSESLCLNLSKIGHMAPRSAQRDGPWVKVFDRHGVLLKVEKAGWRHSS